MEYQCKAYIRTRTKCVRDTHVFQAEIAPNDVLSGSRLYERLAEHAGIKPSMARIYVDAVEGFIKDELAKGNRVDFGLASFYPRLSGGLSVRDADPVSEGVYVRGAVKGRKELLNAPKKSVEPVNREAHSSPRIQDVIDETAQKRGVVAREHEIHIFGKNIPIVPSHEDEGVWLEKRRQGKVVAAEVFQTTSSEVVCVFHEVPAAGKYTLVVGTRCGKGDDFKIRRALAEVCVEGEG